jgi:membrane fusion protein, multidrug efflux system
MTTKSEYMRNIWQIFFAAIVISAAVACGSDSKEMKGDIGDKKAQLEKLKKNKTKIDDDIKKLEEEIAKSDTSSNLNKGKLIAATAITEQAFAHYIDLQGHVDADDISYVTPRGGPAQVKAVYIKKGDFVKKGQSLAKLDDAVQLKQLDGLKTQLAYAEDLYHRQKNLWDQGIGTEVQLKNAENSVNSLKNQITTTITGWEMTNVKSDVNGYVEQLNLKPGETFVGMVGNTPQIMIVNTSALKVITEVPENYLDKIKKGTPVNIKLPDANLEFNSVISLMNQTIGLNTRSVITEAKIPYNTDVHINQVAEVRIKDYANPKAIVIPLTSMQTDEKGKYVYVIGTENGKKVARKKMIEIGQIYGDNIEVKAGLSVGDQLITEGYQSLYEGQPVTTS